MESPFDKSSNTKPETPHAGSESMPEEVREVPYVHYEKTPLSEVAGSGKLIDPDNPASTPDSAADLLDQPLGGLDGTHDRIDTGSVSTYPLMEVAPETKEVGGKSRKRLFLGLGAAGLAGLAGITIVASSIFGSPSNDNEAPKPEPVATAPAEPNPDNSEVPVPSAGENDLAITPENEAEILRSLLFSPEMTEQEKGEKYSSNLTRWANAGATSATWYAWLDAGLPDTETYATEIAKNNTHVYATAMFGEDYESITDPKIVNFIKNAEEGNIGLLTGYLMSYGDEENPNSNTANIEPLKTEFKPLSVTTEDDGTIVVRQETVTNDENTMFAGEITGDGRISDTYITLVANPNDEGSVVISALDISNVN
jgi:hypothetical protein